MDIAIIIRSFVTLTDKIICDEGTYNYSGFRERASSYNKHPSVSPEAAGYF